MTDDTDELDWLLADAAEACGAPDGFDRDDPPAVIRALLAAITKLKAERTVAEKRCADAERSAEDLGRLLQDAAACPSLRRGESLAMMRPSSLYSFPCALGALLSGERLGSGFPAARLDGRGRDKRPSARGAAKTTSHLDWFGW